MLLSSREVRATIGGCGSLFLSIVDFSGAKLVKFLCTLSVALGFVRSSGEVRYS